jgi:hypothetical protein
MISLGVADIAIEMISDKHVAPILRVAFVRVRFCTALSTRATGGAAAPLSRRADARIEAMLLRQAAPNERQQEPVPLVWLLGWVAYDRRHLRLEAQKW